MQVTNDILAALGVTFVRAQNGISEYRLDKNGLKILLAENHNKPVVTVMPVYRVGSRNEAVGFTGATHILEHMMFKGVKDGRTGEIYNFPDRFRPLGGVWNATTWFDRTNYFETVPARHLELCLATESDRMRNLLIKEEEKATEMTVVRNELERGENDPTMVLLLQLYANAFREHPYHHPTIGWTSDVEGISIARLKEFYDQYYWPNNTTLLVMGDFDPAQTLAWIVKYYGVHPASPQPIPVMHTTEPKQEGERRFEIVRAGDSPRVALGFHVPQATHPDTYALSALGTVLGGGSKASRLYKALVETKLVANTFSWHFEQRDPGLFMVFATPAKGVKHEDVEKAIIAVIEKVAAEGVTPEELKRAQVSNRKQMVLQAADPMALANQLGEAESVADWTFYTTYGDRLDAVTVDDVKRVAGTYFARDNKTVGYFIPKAKDQVKEAPKKREEAPKAQTFAERTTKKVLANGLTVQHLREEGTGIVGLSLKLRAGGYFAPEDKPLVAGLTAQLLTAGTATRTAHEIAEAVEQSGVGRLHFGTSNFVVGSTSKVAAADFGDWLALVADVVRNPLFPESELDTLKVGWQSWFEEQSSEPEAVAESKLVQTLYTPDSVFYDKPFDECLAELATIGRDDLVAYHKSAYSPKGSILTVVGDIDLDAALALVEKLFGDWTGEEPKAIDVSVPGMPSARRIDVNIPDKRNAVAVIGHPSTLVRTADDFLAMRIGNAAFGSGFTSRLFKVVRVQHGLTYGIYSMFKDPTVAGAPFLVEVTVNPENVEKAIGLINGIVADLLRDGITEKELADEVGYAAGTFEVQLRTADAIAATLTDFEFFGLGAGAVDTYAADLSALTVDKVNAAIRKYIRPEAFVTVVAGTLS